MNGRPMYRGAVLGLAMAGLAMGCLRSAGEPPKDPLEFRTFLVKTMPEVLEATTCQCCNKSLMKCYEETLEGAAGGCPDT